MPPDSEVLATQHLDVYATKAGQRNPEQGDIEIPAGWEFLPSGDTFLTRTVKAGDAYWLSWQPRSRHRQHRRLFGLWAPSLIIAETRARAEETAARRWAKRVLGAQSRQRQEDLCRDKLEDAIARFLAFAPAHKHSNSGPPRRPQPRQPSLAAAESVGPASSVSTIGLLSASGPISGTASRATTTISMHFRQSTGTRSI
jgi:hypothetical protein